MLDNEKFYGLADRTHFLGGTAATLLFYMFLGSRGAFIAFLLVCVWGAGKEFWYDERYESEEERGSNLRDFLGYVLGGLIGLVIVVFVKVYKGEL